MCKSNSSLSITKRVLLDYIKFKTNNNHQFFASNEYVAKGLDISQNTAKSFINDLIREGYVYKEIDKQGRRILSLTGKPYTPLFEDVSTIDKKVLKQDRDDALRDNQYLNEQLSTSEAHCEQLRMEKTELVLTNAELTREVQALKERVNHLEQRMGAVEKFFIMQGVPKEQLEQIIQNNL